MKNYEKSNLFPPPRTDVFCVRAERGFEASSEKMWYENELNNGGQFDWNYGGNDETWG